MMTGMGVSVGGAGMLRARRRDVSIKPNRRLDRKSSRGMIYENEELRLRTINMNAEVEQGQNDIKKLQRENKQLRREIWSLRDEYDKLEEILKNQKSREGSDESEDRSGKDNDDDDLCLDYSDDDDEEEEEEVVEDEEQENEEQLENAENQKISSEKMSNGLHRLHVDFDDLSIVDEEEEPKRDKDRRNVGQLDSSTGPNYDYNYTEYPLVFPNPNDPNYPKMLPMENPAHLVTPCSRLYGTPLTSLPDSPSDFGPASPIFGSNDHATIQMPVACGPAIGWQSNVVAGQIRSTNQIPGSSDRVTSSSNDAGSTTTAALQLAQRSILGQAATFVVASSAASVPSLPQRRNALPKQRLNIFKDALYKNPIADSASSGETLTQNGWDFSRGLRLQETENNARALVHEERREEADEPVESRPWNQVEAFGSNGSTLPMGEKSCRHFFAPLPSKARQNHEDLVLDESPTTTVPRSFGTGGTSSSSDRTNSTVVSRSQYVTASKGSADIYVNGAFPIGADRTDWQTYPSTDNLPTDDVRNVSAGHSSSNPWIKSQSCQDLSFSDPRNDASFGNGEVVTGTQKLLTKSDNALDNISNSSRPYRSHLNVTLRLPGPRMQRQCGSPNVPKIPKLPTIDYRRLFGNPFLLSFDHGRHDIYNNSSRTSDCQSPISRPLSIQINDTGYSRSVTNDPSYSSPPLPQSAGLDDNNDYYYQPRGYNQSEDPHSRFLLASNQPRANETIALAPANHPSQMDHRMISYEDPESRSYLPSTTAYNDRQESLRTLLPANALNPTHQLPGHYQNLPQATAVYATNQDMATMTRLYYDNVTTTTTTTTKVPAQTQTSPDAEDPSASSSPISLRRRKILRKECRSPSGTIKRPLSPAALRRRDRLRKQNNGAITSSSDLQDSSKLTSHKPARTKPCSLTTSVDARDKLNESRSSSSGQDSPKKDQTRRVSIYFNAKKRPSLTSTRIGRAGGSMDGYSVRGETLDGTTTNSDRERTNSVSSRETIGKERKPSTSSGKVPWCACWGNGCV